MNVLVVFVVTMAVLLLVLIKFKAVPGLALMAASLLLGFLAGMPSGDLANSLAKGFGGTMGSVGLIVLLGGILGDLLGASGSMGELAKALLRKFGKKYDMLALNLAGFIVSIPVYFGAAYTMMAPLVNSLSRVTKKKRAAYASALAVGLILTASIVAPTPGPVAVARQLNGDLGWFILYGLVVCLPASLIAGWLYANHINNSPRTEAEHFNDDVKDVLSDEDMLKRDESKPSAGIALTLILFPIVLIMMRSVMVFVLAKESVAYKVINFVGNNVVALFLGVLLACVVLRKSIADPLSKVMTKSANSFGNMLFTLGAGGCFGVVLKACGLGDALVAFLHGMNLPPLVAAFVLTLLIHAAVGSGTVAMITACSIVGAGAVSAGYSPIIMGLAICCGGAGLTLPTDGAFWRPSVHNGVSVRQSFTSITFSTTFGSVLAFLIVVALNYAAAVLPGLH